MSTQTPAKPATVTLSRRLFYVVSSSIWALGLYAGWAIWGLPR